jgi:hypothetical protein
MGVPFTAGSGVPSIDADGNMVVKGEYADTDHAQLTRKLVNGRHVQHASVSYLEHTMPDGSVERELLNGTFTGVPSNPGALILESRSFTGEKKDGDVMMESRDSGGTTEGNYPESEGPFADPKNRKWPLNTRKRILNAWARIHQEQATRNYNESEIATMMGRIRSAARREGIELSDDNSKSLMELGAKMLAVLAHNGKLKANGPDWSPTQTTPGHTEGGEEVGAESVYDQDDDNDEDDGDDMDGDDLASDENSLAQALHDAACALGFACDGSVAQCAPMTETKSIQVPISIVVAGHPERAQYTVLADGHPIGYGEVKDLISGSKTILTLKSDPGRPVGPYQGVDGMSGENASGTTPGSAELQGGLFLEGTAGAAIAPGFKDQTKTTTRNSSEQETSSPGAQTAEAAAASTKDAAAADSVPSPADVAARHAARLRAFDFRTKGSKHTSINTEGE